MSDFEALFSLFGVVFGLIVAEIALKFADASTETGCVRWGS